VVAEPAPKRPPGERPECGGTGQKVPGRGSAPVGEVREQAPTCRTRAEGETSSFHCYLQVMLTPPLLMSTWDAAPPDIDTRSAEVDS
jgi:hypothetical protein